LGRPSTSLVPRVKTWMAGPVVQFGDMAGHDDEKAPVSVTTFHRTGAA
jgi:hypothetical protein